MTLFKKPVASIRTAEGIQLVPQAPLSGGGSPSAGWEVRPPRCETS